MIDHFTLGVKDYAQSLKFYEQTLRCLYGEDLTIIQKQIPPIAKEVELEDPQTKYVFKANAVVFAGVKFASFIHSKLKSGFSLIALRYGLVEPLSPNSYGSPKELKLAFKATTKEQIDCWYAKAIELGATTIAAPSSRPSYGPDDYAAVVIDPSGYRIEAVLNSAFSTGNYYI
jgi:catechol 2,3-dioxygenase-like lactoylglutathione lyase family enzyme